ncbi:hypothetical protein [uncultured Aquimarina sp.]|uniref:hypothetical protein n=1 Tax=uncultured Aquimarina sp. TaxID=575652 RepID=UPI00262AA84D|nr:hypothetical protein [uncultured Aquimarina sp.]
MTARVRLSATIPHASPPGGSGCGIFTTILHAKKDIAPYLVTIEAHIVTKRKS